ncbi:non-ribosomal peptide synthetase [Rhodanobacter sp. L36]|uniref:non-ribosomal peptide synthetase n=1 Tax=Rhodanobacter sp. L36 TaxID=1747221 RepID=UPI00131B5A3E|nr:non-ribosomal peptide synthetase [Rhodanobacter sp. L36]
MNPTEPGQVELTAVDYDPFAVAVARVVPSTEAQREIWLAAKLSDEASLAYNESIALHLLGELDRSALHAALQSLIDRHDALRATFGPDGETFCVLDGATLAWHETHASSDDAAFDATLAQRQCAAVETPFDLEQGPLFRAELMVRDAGDCTLLLTAHHIVCDGWSWWVIVRELAALYASHRGLPVTPLAPAESFADYALALAAHPDVRTLVADESYWLARYASGAPVLDLPTDRPRPPRRTFASRRIDHVFDAALLTAIKRLGAHRGASLFATLLGGFAALLARVAGHDEVVIGIPAAAQAVDGHENMVGHGVNLLPLRCMPDPAAPFTQLIDNASTTLLDAIDHQQYTFGTLLKKLGIGRDPSRLPLVSVLFNIDQALDLEATAFAGASMTFASTPRSFENFELFINAVQEHGHLRLECQYNRDLFDEATIRRWLGAYETLLRAAVERSDAPLGDLPLVGAAERRALQALQPQATPFNATQCVHEMFETQCDHTPTRIAVRCDATACSYAELDARANRIAHLLRASGVRRGALVGVALDRGIDMLAAMLGALKAGAGYVPLDPGFPLERLNYIVSDGGLAALVTQRKHAQRFDLRGRPVLALDELHDALASTSDARIGRDAEAGDPESIAYVIYTSGSTGQPKGVEIPHRAVVNFITGMIERPGLREDDRLLAVTTLSFDIAVLELFGPLSVGAEVIIARREQAMDGDALKSLFDSSRATVMQATPATWRMLLQLGWKGRADFRALCGGEALAPDLAERLLGCCGELWNLYGPTETTVWSTCARVEDPQQGISIGTPIANTTVWILDARRQLCPIGLPGEIWIGGEGVALGYHQRPDLTAERFVVDPFADRADARMYRTGDRGRWLANGTLEHLGRLDFQVKLRGFRIELGDIEANLARLAEVAHALAVVREDVAGDARLVAYIVPSTAAQLDESALRTHLRDVLPDYMIPQHFVVLQAMPQLPNGKIDRSRLPAPTAGVTTDTTEKVSPRDELEQQVARAMASALGAVALGVDDNFFEHGGHSLLVAQLTATLNRELNLSLPLRTVFEAPTVSRLAAAIRTAGATSAPTMSRVIPRLADRQRAPMSLMQQRLWYVEQLHPGRVVYNTPSAHRLRGPMNEEAFERALRETVRRQPILRTSIEPDDTSAVQRIHDDVEVNLLPVEDLSTLAEDERDAELQRRLDALIAEPFDLAVAPLFRARLFRMGDDDYVFFFMAHHIVWDGWSFDVLYEELSSAYAAFCAGREPPLPPLPVEYGDFAAWHREWMRGDELARQLDHWLNTLRGTLEPLELPTDRPRPARMSGEGGTEWIRLPGETLSAVHALGQRAEATSFMVLLTAYCILLHRLSGQRDVIVGTPVRGRDEADLEPVMGFFVNALPLRVAIDPQASFLDVLRVVRGAVLDAFSYPDVPFEHLVQSLKLPRDDSRSPIYQAMFSFQDVRQRMRAWGDLQHEHLPVFQRGAADDIGLWFIEQEHQLLGGMTYNTDIFDAATAARIRGYYETLLAAALGAPQMPLAQLAMLPSNERALIRQWNDTAAPIANVGMHGLFEAQCDRVPGRIALRHARRTWTYAELDERANRMAHLLRANGVGRGALVGIALDRGPDMVASVLAVLKAGAGYVPLDPEFPRARLDHMVADAGLAALLTQSQLAPRFDLREQPVLELDRLADELDAQSDARIELESGIAPDAIAYVIYTSGSTGQPKGVEIPHRAVVNFLSGMIERPGLRKDDRLLAVTTLSFDIAVLELFGPLSVGGEVILATRDEAMDGEALKDLLATSRATLMQATPATWRMLLQSGWNGPDGFRALCGGEALAPDLAVQLLACCGEVWNLYGPTETTVWSTCWKVENPEHGISIGTPIANTAIRILDEQRRLCPIGVPGEIWIGGAGVALGYRHRADLTAERFVADSFADQNDARMYRTGDRGRWLANGTLEHLGRLDFQVKLRGFRIELGEIETIARKDTAVNDCVAVAHSFTASDQRLVLYVASDENEETLLPRVRALLAAQLPGYMQPQHLVRLDALPQTPNGKTDRKALPAPVLHTPSTPGLGATRSVLADARQQYLADLWCELIGVEQVLARDNFFDVGGHSLLAVDMVARVRRDTGVRLNLLDIATGTLASLAMELPETSAAAAPDKSASLSSRLRRLFGGGSDGGA